MCEEVQNADGIKTASAALRAEAIAFANNSIHQLDILKDIVASRRIRTLQKYSARFGSSRQSLEIRLVRTCDIPLVPICILGYCDAG